MAAVPHRHVVLSLPRRLRPFFRRRKRLTRLARLAYKTVKELLQATGDEGTQAPLEVRRSWVRLIRQVYEVNPLVWSRCGRTMKVIAVIERQGVVRQILAHLGLPTTAPRLRAPPDLPKDLAAEPPREWSSEPTFDDPPVPDPLHG